MCQEENTWHSDFTHAGALGGGTTGFKTSFDLFDRGPQ